MCIHIYIINIQYTHILCKQKLILDAINRCTALIIYIFYIERREDERERINFDESNLLFSDLIIKIQLIKM